MYEYCFIVFTNVQSQCKVLTLGGLVGNLCIILQLFHKSILIPKLKKKRFCKKKILTKEKLIKIKNTRKQSIMSYSQQTQHTRRLAATNFRY